MHSPTDLTAFLRGLRSVRRFDPARPLPNDVLTDILECGRWTGSAKNSQPWAMVVVRERATLAQIASLGQFAGHVADATVAIVLVMTERSRSRSFDEGRLAQNIQLAAWAHGVGSCIGTIFPDDNEDELLSLIDAPPTHGARTVLSLGYPADRTARRVDPGLRSAIPLGRRPVADVVFEERFSS